MSLQKLYPLLPKKPFTLLPKKNSNPYLKSLYTLLKDYHLKHVNRVEFSYDPLQSNVASVRNMAFHLSAIKIRTSNPKCMMRTNVLTNGADASVRVQLENGKEIVYLSGNLTELEMLEHLKTTVNSFFEDLPEDKAPTRK